MQTFDGSLDEIVRVQDVLLDELERTGPVRQLVVERVGQAGPLQHALTLGQRRVHFARV